MFDLFFFVHATKKNVTVGKSTAENAFKISDLSVIIAFLMMWVSSALWMFSELFLVSQLTSEAAWGDSRLVAFAPDACDIYVLLLFCMCVWRWACVCICAAPQPVKWQTRGDSVSKCQLSVCVCRVMQAEHRDR